MLKKRTTKGRKTSKRNIIISFVMLVALIGSVSAMYVSHVQAERLKNATELVSKETQKINSETKKLKTQQDEKVSDLRDAQDQKSEVESKLKEKR